MTASKTPSNGRPAGPYTEEPRFHLRFLLQHLILHVTKGPPVVMTGLLQLFGRPSLLPPRDLDNTTHPKTMCADWQRLKAVVPVGGFMGPPQDSRQYAPGSCDLLFSG